MSKCHPKGRAVCPFSSCFLIHFFFFSKHFQELLVWEQNWTIVNPLKCRENDTGCEFGECKTRSRNFCNPLELKDLKDTQERKTSAVTRAWDFMWEDTKSCLHPTSFFAKYCLSKRVGGLSGTSINGNIYILGFHNYRSVFPYKLSVEIFPHKD